MRVPRPFWSISTIAFTFGSGACCGLRLADSAWVNSINFGESPPAASRFSLTRQCNPEKLAAGIAYEVTPVYWWPPEARESGLLCFWLSVKAAVLGSKKPILLGALDLDQLASLQKFVVRAVGLVVPASTHRPQDEIGELHQR